MRSRHDPVENIAFDAYLDLALEFLRLPCFDEVGVNSPNEASIRGCASGRMDMLKSAGTLVLVILLVPACGGGSGGSGAAPLPPLLPVAIPPENFTVLVGQAGVARE